MMKQSILQLELCACSEHSDTYRTIFKTKHGRVLYLELIAADEHYVITDCFYLDRNQNRSGTARYSVKPRMLQTVKFHKDDLLTVIEKELDKKFYGVYFMDAGQVDLPLDQYLKAKSESVPRKYHFLIMVGEGESYNGLPIFLRTRLKNKLHRSIYIELRYYKDGKGVVEQCCYYDRKYKRQDISITPPHLLGCFFVYSREGILNFLNHEICCDFTHMIVTDGIDIDSSDMPLCGAV